LTLNLEIQEVLRSLVPDAIDAHTKLMKCYVLNIKVLTKYLVLHKHENRHLITGKTSC